MKLFTIGFTKKSAEKFFSLLRDGGVRRIIDIRLNNTSQLAGFAKKDDLIYFLKMIGDIDYVHKPELAPTQEIMDEFKKKKGSWDTYEKKFLSLLAKRGVDNKIVKSDLDGCCLLCSEDTPQKCHRRLVAEYFSNQWPEIEIVHLV
ncbi:MAG: DUF488 domain-containing protein [Deltaproteobacteria bacterium]|nr:DUF488 domain-containing protein [Deltaproteobacteria bacterium]